MTFTVRLPSTGAQVTLMRDGASRDLLPDTEETVKQRAKIIRESTPIICVKPTSDDDADIGSVHRIIVEKLQHDVKGPILPDLLHFESASFPNDGDGNFIQVMQQALEDARSTSDAGRYRWWVVAEPSKHFPAGIQGRSAQVAAACCMLALNLPQKGKDPLLDERVAITACLGDADPRLENWMLTADPADKGMYRAVQVEEVDCRTLPEKFAAAVKARLVAVLVCKSQLPFVPEYSLVVDDERGSVLIQPVANLDEALDSLLIGSFSRQPRSWAFVAFIPSRMSPLGQAGSLEACV